MRPVNKTSDLSVVFIFSHPTLLRVWQQAQAILHRDQIRALVLTQTSAIDWEKTGADDIATADALYLNTTRHFSNFDTIHSYADDVALVVPGGMEAVAAVAEHDPRIAATTAAYLKAGTVADLVNATKHLLYKAGKLAEPPAPPSEPLLCGIYDPGAAQPFTDLETFLTWKQAQPGANATQAIIAFCFSRSSWLDGDLSLADSIIAALAAKNLLALPLFCDSQLAAKLTMPAHPLHTILKACAPRLAAIWNMLFNHSSADSREQSPLASYGVPVFQILRNYRQNLEQWQDSHDGLPAFSISYSLTKPEMIGCIEPTIIACTTSRELNGIGVMHEAEVVGERLDHLINRSLAWLRLRQMPNCNKRVAIMLHNAACKSVEATLGSAAGLDAAQSTVELLRRLAAENYCISDIPADGAALLKRFEQHKAFSEFRWTNVSEIVAKGGVLEQVDSQRYLADFAQLPATIQAEVNAAWGQFPGEAMVYNGESGEPHLLVTGLRFGNALVMIEPKRGCWGAKCNGEVCRILHQPDIAPSHHWLATYWYVQRNAEAIISMGTESPVEYLPGKRIALGQSCYPEISLGHLPVIYPYIINAAGEGLMAKRRGRAVLIDHLTAPKCRLDQADPRWDDLDELYRQYTGAKASTDRNRMNRLATALRHSMTELNLIAPDCSEDMLIQHISELPRRLRLLRQRVTEQQLHVLGRVPSTAMSQLYIAEATSRGLEGICPDQVSENLQQTAAELDNLITALNAGFVPPGPSGHLGRGKVEALPTGRNFYAIDLHAIPTVAAYDVGAQMGAMLLRRYLDSENSFPRSIGIALWSNDAFRADGELTSQILWLLGCRPIWTAAGRIKSVEPIALEELTMVDSSGATRARPRIDVVVQISGIVRDTLPNLCALIDDAVACIAELDEPAQCNYLRANVEKRLAELRAEISDSSSLQLTRIARQRCFSSKPGSYGVGVGLAIDASAWQDDQDLAEVYINWTGYAYDRPGDDREQTLIMQHYAGLLRNIDIAYQKAAAAESDALSLASYAGFQGGMAAATRALAGGTGARLYWGDSTSSNTPEIRDLGEELDLSLSARLLNPAWIEQRKLEGYTGAGAVAGLVNCVFHWSATSRLISKQQFDAICRVYIENDENRNWMAQNNLYALEEVSRRLLEASARNLWQADANQIEQLHQCVLQIDGDLEERIGEVKGEFQGGAVEIKTRSEVEKWQYQFRIKQ